MHSSAWHMIVGSNLANSSSIQDKLVQDIVQLQTELDTKETNFFFSSLLTGVLSHHLGWVETVMPSSRQGHGENSLNKQDSTVVDHFSYLHWYDQTKVQFKDLHGMVGCPVRAAKTLILTEDEELARKIVFVLSYFIRCSQIFERKLKFEDNSKINSIKYTLDRKTLKKKVEEPVVEIEAKPPSLPKSNSSPIMEHKCPSNKSMKKSKSFIFSLNDLDQGNSAEGPTDSTEKVNFLIGENENLAISEHNLDEVGKDLESVNISEDVIVTKGVPAIMKAEEDYLNITEVPLPQCEVVASSPARLPALICCSEHYMPGSVLQGCYGWSQGETWRTSLHADLLATSSNSFVSGVSEESICVVGDCCRHEVSLVSAQQVVVGRQAGLPIPLSPLVANILDSVATTASFSLPAQVVLHQLEVSSSHVP